MENRFGFKDFILAALLVVLIGVVFLGMKQLDRQWDAFKTIQDTSEKQFNVMLRIDKTLNDIDSNLPTAVAVPAKPADLTPTTRDSTGSALANPTPPKAVGEIPTATARFPHGDPFGELRKAEKQPNFARGDWLIDNFGAKLKTLTYPVASDLYSMWLQSRVLDGLIYRDPDTLEYHPQLARDWEISADGMKLTFHLRRGLLFSDAQPLTGDDVVYSYQLLMDPKINCPRFKAYYDKIKSVVNIGNVDKRDGDTIVFTMKEPYYEALDLCGTLSIVPKHFYEALTPEEINNNPGILIGSGPYRLPDPKSWRPGKKVELVRNEAYWGFSPTFDRCVFLEVEDESAEETMFGNRELDIFAAQPEQYKRLVDDPKTSAHANHYEFDTPMSGYYFIAWNEKRNGKNTLFTDKLVRRAMTMMIDRQQICHDVFLDYATPTSGPFAMTSPQADLSVKPWPHDVDAARKLLEDAGFKMRDDSGVLKNDKGDPFSFRLTYGANNATFERVVLFVKDSFAKAGITLIQDPVDWPVLQKKLDERDFDAISLGWSGTPESDMYQEFHSSQMADQGDNFMSYSNPRLDEVVATARITVDSAKRMPLWHEAHRILHEDQPYTFLMSRKSLRLIDNRIENIQKVRMGLNFVYVWTNPMPWYVPMSLQKYRSN